MMSALSAIFLSLALALASVTMATARAQSASVAGEITICSGYGVVSVAVDADGNPVGPVHPCPDCLAGLHLAMLPTAPATALPPQRSVRLAQPRAGAQHTQTVLQPKSRGPPVVI
jgi:hypothetical protein